jgi:hypothetical protein
MCTGVAEMGGEIIGDELYCQLIEELIWIFSRFFF